MIEHNQSFGPDNIGEQLADYIISGIRTPEELVIFCINKGMKPQHAHDLVKAILKRMGIEI